MASMYKKEQYIRGRDELQVLQKAMEAFDSDGIVSNTLRPLVNELQRMISEGLQAELQEEGGVGVEGARESTVSSDQQAREFFPLIVEDVNITVDTDIQAVFLATHLSLVSMGFVCIVEVPSSVPGFAPAVRDLPRGRIIHESWRQGETCLGAYRHKSAPGKKLVVKVECSTDTASGSRSCNLNIAEGAKVKRSDIDSTSLFAPRSDFAHKHSVNNIFSILADSQAHLVLLKSLVGELLPACLLKSATPSATASSTLSQTIMQSDPQLSGSTLSPPIRQSWASAPASAVGRDDLHPPLGGHVGPALPFIVGPGASNNNPSGYGGWGEGSGSLVGPSHPMFAPRPELPPYGEPSFFPGYEGMPGLPVPRFDPFGPVTGPNGPNVGNVGMGRGGMFPPGQGRGAGRGARRGVPGEPDPDHLPPPGMPF